MLRGLLWAVAILAGCIGLLALCVRTAGGDHAWQVGLFVLALAPAVGFATRDRG